MENTKENMQINIGEKGLKPNSLLRHQINSVTLSIRIFGQGCPGWKWITT